MKIEYKDNNKISSFSVADCGEVFKYDRKYYMKCYSASSPLINAINIVTGHATHFQDDTKVEMINCKFVIEQLEGIK